MIFGLNYWFDTYYNHISYFISLRINNKIFNCACSLDIHTVVKELRSKIFGQHPGYFKAVFLMHTRIIIVSIYKYTVYIMSIIHQYFFSFWATFNSFVSARYSDISVDCNDFEAGFLITYI
jgi:hypothetical protein